MKEENRIKKNYLKRYKRYKYRIKQLEERLIDINDQMKGLQSKEIRDMPAGGKSLTLDDLLIRKEETEKRIENIKMTSQKVRKEIFECIDQLDDCRYAEILELFFIDGMSLEDIAELKHYSVRHTSYLYGCGINAISIKR